MPGDAPNVWDELATCRSVKVMVYGARPAHPARARVAIWGARGITVRCRQSRGESIEAMLWRALDVLAQRHATGMPTPSPREREQRKRREILRRADTSKVM